MHTLRVLLATKKFNRVGALADASTTSPILFTGQHTMRFHMRGGLYRLGLIFRLLLVSQGVVGRLQTG
jgi:hypothetical protein